MANRRYAHFTLSPEALIRLEKRAKTAGKNKSRFMEDLIMTPEPPPAARNAVPPWQAAAPPWQPPPAPKPEPKPSALAAYLGRTPKEYTPEEVDRMEEGVRQRQAALELEEEVG